MKRKAADIRGFFSDLPSTSLSSEATSKVHREAKRTLKVLNEPHSLEKYFECVPNEEAERLARRLGATVTYLSEDGRSWVVLARGWRPPPSQIEFSEHWSSHPTSFHELKVFGKVCKENRWSQSWGLSYHYSGSKNCAKPIPEGSFLE